MHPRTEGVNSDIIFTLGIKLQWVAIDLPFQITKMTMMQILHVRLATTVTAATKQHCIVCII